MDFRDEIREQLKGLDNKQVCQFAWLCGVRALPFLGEERGFAYWPEKDIQKHLCSIFYALDTCAQAAFLDDFMDSKVRNKAKDDNAYSKISKDSEARAKAVITTHSDAFDAVIAIESFAETAKTATYAIVNFTRAIKHAAYTVSRGQTEISYDTSDATISAVAELTDATILIKAFKSNKDFLELLLKDFKAIKENKFGECNHDICIYGKLWNNFQEDLKAIGCGYWAKLYDNLFENGFDKLDTKELELRLSVPDEITAEGAEEVAKHILVMKKQGTANVQRARLILIGSAAAGKTTLVRKLDNENAPLTGYDSTHGVNRDTELDFNGVKTQVWDFGGQVIYHASHRCFMKDRCIYVLVVNTRKNDDYRDNYKFTYWLDTVKDYAKDNAKVFIVINEQDDRKYNFDGTSEALKAEYKGLIQDFYAFNIGTDIDSLRNFREILSEYIQNKGHQQIGAKDKKALDEINLMFENGTQLLKPKEVDKILDKCRIKDKERVLALFDTLGVALNYDDFDDFVIDPYWVTHGIYKVIDYMQNRGFKQPVFKAQFKEIFKDESDKYPEDKLNHIFDLMAHYKIGFRNRGVEGLFVPCVAASIKPLGTTEPSFDNYIVKFNRDRLKEFPAGFFDKFIADNSKEMNKRDKKPEFWQTGMVLINNERNANAIVEMNKNIEIEITAWGPQKEQYADELIRRFDVLLKEFDYIAIGKEETDILTGTQGQDYKLYSAADKLIEEIAQKKAENKGSSIYLINPTIQINPTIHQEVKMGTDNRGGTIITGDNSGNGSANNSPGAIVGSKNVTNNEEIHKIEDWLRQITEELNKSNIKNEELTGAIESLQALIKVPKPNRNIIKSAVDTTVNAIKSIGYGVASNAAWQHLQQLLHNLPI